MTKGCYTCRRRRIVCDNEFPTCRKCRAAGRECLGYQKPLVWVKGGVASRGKMMGLSYDDVASQAPFQSASSTSSYAVPFTPGIHSPSRQLFKPEVADGAWTQGEGEENCNYTTEQFETSRSSSHSRRGALVHSRNIRLGSPRYSLVDPLFQDLNKTWRFYMEFFCRDSAPCLALYDSVRNPYRELIPYIQGSPVLADSLAAIGAIQFAYKSETNHQALIGAARNEVSKAEHASRDTKAYDHFLLLKQRALHQLFTEVSHPMAQIDDRTVAAMFVLILLDVIESGNMSWMYHLEGAKNILRTRFSDVNDFPTSDGIDSFLIEACLITEIMGSTLARPGVLSRPFYSPSMGSAMLKRLERTAWVGCPAYLLDVIFFVHAQRYSQPDQTADYSLSFISSFGETTRAESPLAVLRHIDAFDPDAWAEEMQSFLTLSDLSARIAVARAYKAAVYLYARRVLSKTSAFAIDCALTESAPLQSRKAVENELIRNMLLIPPEDEHFKCVIWPTFIAGAESTSPEQRAITLRILGLLWNGLYSLNLQNAAFVLKVMWDKQDERQRNRQSFSVEENDDEGADWIQELDQSSTDWLFI